MVLPTGEAFMTTAAYPVKCFVHSQTGEVIYADNLPGAIAEARSLKYKGTNAELSEQLAPAVDCPEHGLVMIKRQG
jgi:hypothetical protein